MSKGPNSKPCTPKLVYAEIVRSKAGLTKSRKNIHGGCREKKKIESDETEKLTEGSGR